MSNIRILKRRIRSATNIAQITKAMELVAASKMKKAQQKALAGKVYAQKIFTMVHRLAKKTDISHHPLLAPPSTLTGKRLVILISTNKGLCGGLNTNLFRFLKKTYESTHTYVTIGRKGADFLTRTQAPLLADFSEASPFVSAVPAIIDLITKEYMTSKCDGVDIVFSGFISAIQQVPAKKTILPLTIQSVETENESQMDVDFLIEPSITEVFYALVPHFIENQLRDAILQAEASEHSARMVAMRSATDNALSLIDEITLLFNKARQEKITYEISDMVTARLAVE